MNNKTNGRTKAAKRTQPDTLAALKELYKQSLRLNAVVTEDFMGALGNARAAILKAEGK